MVYLVGRFLITADPETPVNVCASYLKLIELPFRCELTLLDLDYVPHVF